MALNDDDKQWFRGEIQHAKDEMIAAARDMQTEVLRYIGNVDEPFNVRMRHIEANTASPGEPNLRVRRDKALALSGRKPTRELVRSTR